MRQIFDLLPIAGQRGRVEGDEVRRLLQAGEIGREPVLLGLHGLKGLCDVPLLQLPLCIGLDEAFPLALDLGEPPFETCPVGDQVGGKALTLLIVGLDVGHDEVWMGEVGLQAVEDRPFDGLQIVGAAMVAGTRLLHLRALDAMPPLSAVLDGHARAASAAFQQARQNAFRFASMARMRTAARMLDGNGAVIEVLVDDSQMRRVGGLPLGLRIRARHAVAGVGVLDHADLVPNDAARIQLVEDQPIVPRQGAVDGGCGPMATARRRYAAPVQGDCDFAGCLPCGVGRENLADDRRFIGFDLKFACLSG